MKKILIIENNILATNTIRKAFVDSLIHQGFEVSVLTSGTKAEIELAQSKGYNIVPINSSTQNPFTILQYIKGVYLAVKKYKPDVCLTFTIRPAIWGNLVTRVLHVPTITNITGIGPLFSSNNIAYKMARTLYKFVLKRTHTIFFQNKDDMNLFVENNFVKQQNICLIPGSGVDYDRFAPIPKEHIHDSFVFLFIGRLLKDKGITEFVAASRRLKQQGINFTSVVVGSLWTQNLKKNTITQQDLDEWVQEGVIQYEGHSTDVRQQIANADCFVLPSYREGTSNVLLEASSMEKPCITCDTTGCREIVEDKITGLLCKVADAEDLTEKMKQMISFSYEKRRQMGVDARKKVIKEYDKKIVINKYLDVIQSITKG